MPSQSFEKIRIELDALHEQVVRLREREKELVEVQQALRESEEKYRNLVERAQDGILIIQDGLVTYCNPYLAQMWCGEIEEIVGTPFTDYVHPKERAKLADRYHQRMEGKSIPAMYETLLLRQDGSLLHAEVSAGMITYQGQPADLVIVRDISERKRAERQAQQHAAQLEALHQISLEIASELDLDTLLRSIATRAANLLGGRSSGLYLHRPRRDVLEWAVCVGHSPIPLGDTLQRGEGLAGKVWKTGEPIVVHDYRKWQGQATRYQNLDIFSVVSVPVRWGNEFLGVLDVEAFPKHTFSSQDAELLSTLSMQAAIAIRNARLFARLQENARQMHALYETSRALSSSIQAEPVIRAILQAIYHLLGCEHVLLSTIDEKAQTIGARHGIWKGQFDVFPEWIQMAHYPLDHLDITADICRTGKTEIIDQYDERFNREIWTKYGHEKFLRIFMPLQMNERVLGTIEVAYDKRQKERISDQEFQMLQAFTDQAAVALQNAQLFETINQELEERKQMEAERKELQTKLERAQRMEALGVLAGGVAHDLNNILGPMVAYPDLILMDLPPESPVRPDLLQIKEAAERAAAVVQDLLTLARRGTYRMIPLNLNDVVESYLRSPSLQDLEARNPNIMFETLLAPDLLNVMGSVPHLSKVIMNLVTNAFEATPHGGQVTIQTACQSLDRPLFGYEHIPAGDYVTLHVIDNGVGIEEKDLGRIFEPFYTKKEMGRSGSGLGLAVVYGVIHDHKGYVDVKTEVGQGSDFILYFPTTTASHMQADEQGQNWRGTETVLVVDDLAVQRELASKLLHSLGYQVATVEDGHAAVEYLQKQPADILVLDMIMADEFDGLDTYREIAKISPGQKAVIASGFSETERVKEAQELGAGVFVKKPYTLKSLGQAIRSELDQDTERHSS